jgi:hypothetical protein
MVRLAGFVFVARYWLVWAMIVLPIALIASATGHPRAARGFEDYLRWRRVL